MSEKERYVVTEKAGRFVAGERVNGVGSELYLTPDQAKYELKSGTIVKGKTQPAKEKAPEPDPVADAKAAVAEAQTAFDAADEDGKADAKKALDDAKKKLKAAESKAAK